MESRYIGAKPPSARQRTLIHRVTTSEVQQFVIYSKNIFGQYTHWANRRSHECRHDAGRCKGCENGWPQKFLGYLYCHDMQAKEECFLELTQTACDLLCVQVPEGENFRGLQVRIRKTKGGPKGRYIIDVLERRVDPATCPAERDPREVLQFLWNCKKAPIPLDQASV